MRLNSVLNHFSGEQRLAVQMAHDAAEHALRLEVIVAVKAQQVMQIQRDRGPLNSRLAVAAARGRSLFRTAAFGAIS